MSNLSLFKRRVDDQVHILVEFGPHGNIAQCGVQGFNVNHISAPLSAVTCPDCLKIETQGYDS